MLYSFLIRKMQQQQQHKKMRVCFAPLTISIVAKIHKPTKWLWV